MKHFVKFLLVAVLLLIVLPSAGAAEIHDLDDGYMVIEIIEVDSRSSGTKSGSKQYTYYNDGGEAQWRVVLTGSFTYTGSGATCTSSSVSTTVYQSDWYVIDKYSSRSGNMANASATFGYRSDGITSKRVPVSLSLTCDANGNLS